jgi:hypothetical protein
MPWIVRYAYRITNVEQLARELEKQGFCVQVSLLSQSDLNEMVCVINDTLSRGTLSSDRAAGTGVTEQEGLVPKCETNSGV